MTDLTLFDGGTDGVDPGWFHIDEAGRACVVASRFAKAIGFRDAANATRVLDDDEWGYSLVSTPGGDQRVSVVYELGMYRLLFRSSHPNARNFTKRAAEIIRQLRETGVVDMRPPEYQIPQSFADALELAAAQTRALEAAQAQIAADAPKVSFFDDLVDREGHLLAEQVARALGVGRNTMLEFLRERGALLVRPKNDPCAEWVRRGWAFARPNGFVDGRNRAATTTVFSPAGAERVAALLRKHGVIA